MTPNEWLNHLASNLASRLPRGRTHLATFAPALSKDIPARWLTAEMADAVEGAFRSLPTYGELRQAIQRHGETLPAAAAGPTSQAQSEEDVKTELWFDFARKRLAEDGDHKLPHLLALLRQNSRPAWLRFAEAYAPEVVAEERARQRELEDRKAGRLPPLRVPHPDLRHIEGPQGRGPVKRTEPTSKPKIQPAYLTPEQERLAWGAVAGVPVTSLPPAAQAGLRALEARETARQPARTGDQP